MTDKLRKTEAFPDEDDLRVVRERVEIDRDEELSSASTRPGVRRARVLSVRLNSGEFDALSDYAQALEVTVSALVRGWVLDQLKTTSESPVNTVERIARELDQLRRQLVA